MAGKTLIGGTAYEIKGGRTLVNGTAYGISGGKTLVNGTAYKIEFGKYKYVNWIQPTSSSNTYFKLPYGSGGQFNHTFKLIYSTSSMTDYSCYFGFWTGGSHMYDFTGYQANPTYNGNTLYFNIQVRSGSSTANVINAPNWRDGNKRSMYLSHVKGTFYATSETDSFNRSEYNANYSTNYGLYLFSSLNPSMVMTPMKAYEVIIYEWNGNVRGGGTVLFDYKPAIRKSDGMIGFHDVVNDVFVTGVGSFTYG